jgi:hypothetical protein
MKKFTSIFIFILLGFVVSKGAPSITAETIMEEYLSINEIEGATYEIMTSDDVAAIVKVSYKGYSWYETICWAAPIVLPKVAFGLCMVTIKNPAVCTAVEIGTEMLIDLACNESHKGRAGSIAYVAGKTENRGTLKFATTNYSYAKDAKKALREHKDKNYVSWQSVYDQNSKTKPENINTRSYNEVKLRDNDLNCENSKGLSGIWNSTQSSIVNIYVQEMNNGNKLKVTWNFKGSRKSIQTYLYKNSNGDYIGYYTYKNERRKSKLIVTSNRRIVEYDGKGKKKFRHVMIKKS